MPRANPIRILVLDDDESVCRQAGTWLRDAAFDVVTFTSAAEALAHVARAPAQLALVDLRLGDTDGIETLTALRAALPGAPLIALAAFPETAQVIAAMRAGARDLLDKPLRREPLLAAVEAQLEQSGVSLHTEETFNRWLGGRIRLARTAADRTLAEVAADCGLTGAQLSQIELGKSGTTTWTLARICSSLRTPMHELLRQT